MIRRATLDDAADLAAVEIRTFRHAYADILDPAFLADQDPVARAEEWRTHLELEDRLIWVAEVEGRVVGFASVLDEELRMLYVDPFAQGAGVGSDLLETAKAARARELVVFEANGHGRHFYEDRGWRDAGPAGEWLGRPLRRYVP